MKLLITSMLATLLVAPAALADCGKCDKDKKKDKNKEETTLVAGKCDRKKDCDKDDEAAVLA